MLMTSVGTSYAAPSTPKPPQIQAPKATTIAWHQCYDALEILNVKDRKDARAIGSDVSIRKVGSGKTFNGGRICGYMGSGTYIFTVRTNWEYRWTGPVESETYGPNPQLVFKDPENSYFPTPFTCTKNGGQRNDEETGEDFAPYACAFNAPYQRVGSVAFFINIEQGAQGEGLPDGSSLSIGCDGCNALDVAAWVPRGSSLPETFTGTVLVGASQVEKASGVELPDEVVTGTVTTVETEWREAKLATSRHTVRIQVKW